MAKVDFALIAHLESWSTAATVISALRGLERPPIPLQELRQILPWIPPRVVCRVSVSSVTGTQVSGVYIDCFIPPDRLEGQFLRDNLVNVRRAAECAIREQAGVASLGGFTSILLESKTDLLPPSKTAFTTGNTLTVALIMQGVERALALAGRDLRSTNVLIIGASGDIGSGCAGCLATRVNRLLLCARNANRLQAIAAELSISGTQVDVATDVTQLVRGADLVICAASLPAPELFLDALSPNAIVCDAGYPKNLRPDFAPQEGAIFFGGFGQAAAGIRLCPDLLGTIYPYTVENVSHGCLLEAVTLAMERRFEPFSRGRGLITPSRVEEMWQMALKHGIGLPPLFNAHGLVEERISYQCREPLQ